MKSLAKVGLRIHKQLNFNANSERGNFEKPVAEFDLQNADGY